MFFRYRTQGVVIKRDDWREADRFFTVYTKDFGKIKVLGRGIRKIASKLKSGMEVFYLSEIEFIQGKNYKTLVDAVLIEKFDKLRKSLKKTIIAYKILRIFDGLIQGQERDDEVWGLLLDSLKELNNREDYRIVYYYFLWNFLSILGYNPNLYKCSACQEDLKEKENYFDLEEGGVFCLNCFQKEKKGKKISPDLIKVLRLLLRDKEKAFNLKIGKKEMKELKDFSENYLALFK